VQVVVIESGNERFALKVEHFCAGRSILSGSVSTAHISDAVMSNHQGVGPWNRVVECVAVF
jgi:hypothetical protein